MGVYASSPDQVILSLLWRTQDVGKYGAHDLAEVIGEFQERTGIIIYGPVYDNENKKEKIYSDLCADLESLEDRQLINRNDNCLSVTIIAAPVASALVLPSPFTELEHIVREKIVQRKSK